MKKIYLVGIGPGNPEHLTPAALAAMKESDVVIGYTLYIRLAAPLLPGKELLSTPMTQERRRCRLALETAAAGRTVCLISGGDAGVYGMASLLLELASDYPPLDIEVIPGITAALGGAALLGAPLSHDFAVVSLSDLLTPWETIEKRLELGAQADFVLCLYNPASKRRRDTLRRACSTLLRHRAPGTPCGIARNIGREGQESAITTLQELQDWEADMFTTVFIGNSQTKVIGQRLVTPRGYENPSKEVHP